MTELKSLLDELAGPETPTPTTFAAETIARGRRTRRRGRLAVAAATAAVAVGAAGWATALPPADDVPVAGGSGPSAGPTTCAQLITDYGLELVKTDRPGVSLLRLGGFGKPTEPVGPGESAGYLMLVKPSWITAPPRPEATIEVPPPGPKGWPEQVWSEVIRTCYPNR